MPQSQYAQYLIELANRDIPEMEFDANNASTIFSLQALSKRLLQAVKILAYQEISRLQDEGVITPPPPPPPPPPAAVYQQQHQGYGHPHPGLYPQNPYPNPSYSPQAGPVGGQVTDVMITRTGTRVSVPGMPPAVLPPGVVHIDPTQFMPGHMPQPQIPHPHASQPATGNPPAEVFLPQGGGGLPPVLAQQNAESTGARNITQDPAPSE